MYIFATFYIITLFFINAIKKLLIYMQKIRTYILMCPQSLSKFLAHIIVSVNNEVSDNERTF